MEETKERDLIQGSSQKHEFTQLVREKQKVERSARGLSTNIKLPQPSPSTLKRLKKKLGITADNQTGSSKTTTRLRARAEVENSMTAAAIMALMSDVPDELLFSTDAVTLQLGAKKGERVTVHMWAGSKKMLADRGLSPGFVGDKSQYRCMPLLISHNSVGQIVHTAALISDRAISRREIHRIGVDGRLSVWLLPTGYDEVKLFTLYEEEFLAPQIAKIRADLATPAADPLFSSPDTPTPSLPSTSASSSGPTAPRDQSVVAELRTVQTFDGAFPQIKAVLQDGGLARKFKELNIELVKFAAAASMIQQPADVGRMHHILHEFLKKAKLEHTQEMSSTAMRTFVTSVFDQSKIPASSKQAFRSALLWLEGALSKAFTIPSIKDAWSTTGYRPFNAAQIMSGWFNWPNITAEQAERLLACLPECTDIAAELGRVPDHAIHRILEKNGVDTSSFFERGLEARPLEEGPVSYERCVWLNCEGFLASEQRKREAAAQEEESKQERKLQLQQKRDETARRKVEAQQRREYKAAKKQQIADSAAILAPTMKKQRGKKRQLEEQEDDVAVEEEYKCARSSCASIYEEGSKWFGCSVCEYWVCEKAACKRNLKAHESCNHCDIVED